MIRLVHGGTIRASEGKAATSSTLCKPLQSCSSEGIHEKERLLVVVYNVPNVDKGCTILEDNAKFADIYEADVIEALEARLHTLSGEAGLTIKLNKLDDSCEGTLKDKQKTVFKEQGERTVILENMLDFMEGLDGTR